VEGKDEQNFEKDESSFVTSYAATNPEEDFAETFGSFIFNKKGKSYGVLGKKENFF